MHTVGVQLYTAVKEAEKEQFQFQKYPYPYQRGPRPAVKAAEKEQFQKYPYPYQRGPCPAVKEAEEELPLRLQQLKPPVFHALFGAS